MVLPVLAALPGCYHVVTRAEAYNRWKERCYELSRFYRPKLEHPPYHPTADRGADRCSTPDPEFQWAGDAENMPILVANFFYHYDIVVRRKAFDMLEAYHCERDKTCQDLAHLIDIQITATLEDQAPAWKTEFHQRARDFYRYLLTKH